MSERAVPSQLPAVIPASPGGLHTAVEAARAFAAAHDLGTADTARLCIVIEELIANVIDHAGLNPDDRLDLCLWRRKKEVLISIADSGAPFDPRKAESAALDPNRAGGAGLRLLGSWARISGYASVGGRNRLCVRMTLNFAPSTKN